MKLIVDAYLNDYFRRIKLKHISKTPNNKSDDESRLFKLNKKWTPPNNQIQ